MEMDLRLMEAMAKISTPLAVVGAVATGFFYVCRKLVEKSNHHLARRILNFIFIFSMVICIVGLIAWAAVEIRKSPPPEEPGSSSKPDDSDLGSQKVSLEKQERTVREILLSLAKQVGAGTALSKDLKGLDDTMLLGVKESKLSDVLNDLCTVKGWTCTIEEDPSPVILVVPAQSSSS
jgi:hypothetical protein